MKVWWGHDKKPSLCLVVGSVALATPPAFDQARLGPLLFFLQNSYIFQLTNFRIHKIEWLWVQPLWLPGHYRPSPVWWRLRAPFLPASMIRSTFSPASMIRRKFFHLDKDDHWSLISSMVNCFFSVITHRKDDQNGSYRRVKIFFCAFCSSIIAPCIAANIH